jgi:acyl-CoA thioesterase-1
MAPETPTGTRIDILAFGNSLTFGYELPREESYPFLLEGMLLNAGHNVRVINEGVNGDTTRGGLLRLPSALAIRPEIVILELGINDAFMGRDPARIAQDLDSLLRMCMELGAEVLLAGMQAFDFMDPDYAEDFNAIYPVAAEKYGIELLPDFMGGVVEDPTLLMADGVHPNAAGTRIISEGAYPAVEGLVKKVQGAK